MSAEQAEKRTSLAKKALLLAVAVAVLSLAALFCLEATAREISILGNIGEVGEVVEVPISIKGNPGIAAFVLQVAFDESYLEPLEVAKSDLLNGGSFVSNLELPRRTPEKVSVLWADVADLEGDGTLCTVRFRVKRTARSGIPLTLSYRSGDIANAAMEKIEFSVRSAKIKTA